MASLVYIHGFNSSPDSDKARQTCAWLAEQRPDITFVCPFLSPFPGLAMTELETVVSALSGTLYFAGSSMGGFYATYLAAKYQSRAVLINPAVRPWLGRDYLLGDQANYHTGEVHRIEQKHLDQLQHFEIDPITEPEDFLVLLQTGDEVLDYRLAEDKYAACQLVVEPGGDHGFVGFEKHLPAIIEFLTH
ncbi:MAG: esterase YqiA [Gammaproteobacteria bacterium]|nr:esterase YqiA [Gammaproteobacteria bacterium]MBQ0841182.1 esterase YqiA [Gammaproteobacteria bacterium]